MPLTANEVTDEKPAEGNSWPTEDTHVISWVSDRQKKAEQRLGEWYEDARIDFQFKENKQWTDEDASKLTKEHRVAVTFNRIAPIINAILGQEVANRQEVKFLPRRVGVAVADSMNDAVKWVRETCNAEDEDSDAFADMVTCGMGWTVSQMDYEENVEGDGKVLRRDPLLMRWDPAARRKNLADKKWVQSDYWMTKDSIEERWPDADLTGLVDLDKPSDRNSPHDQTEAWKYKNDASGKQVYQDQWRVIHHVEHFTRPIHRVLDPSTGKIGEYPPKDFKKIKANAEALGIPLQHSKANKRVYWEAWTVGSTVLQCGEAEIQRGFQYECMTCFRERETGYWFGMVRLMLDPQRYANRMASLLMSILATGAKGGVLYETGAFANPKKAKADWARTDSAIELTAGAIAAQKVQAKPPVQLPAGAADMMQFAITSIRDVSGVNIDMLGMADRDQPGIVEDMRTKSGLTILAPVFDAIRLYRKRQGIILAEFVEKFLSDGRLIRILGPEGQQFIPLIRNPETIEYDVVVDESPASRDVKERTWAVMKDVGPILVQQGVPLPPEVLDYAPIPESLAMAFKKAIAEKAKQPPQPPPEVQKVMAKAQADQQVAAAKAQADMMIEQARTVADERIAMSEARIKAATEQARDASQMELEKLKAALAQQTAMMTAIIGAIGKVEVARVGAKQDEGSEFVKPEAYQ